jgi:hypothetical protein
MAITWSGKNAGKGAMMGAGAGAEAGGTMGVIGGPAGIAAGAVAGGAIGAVGGGVLGGLSENGGFSKGLASLDPTTHSQIAAPAAAPQITAPVAPTSIAAAPQVTVPGQGPAPATIAKTTGPTAAYNGFNTDKAYTPDATAAQNALMAQLAGQANGTAPSLAQNQLQQGQQANIAATMAALASQRGQANPLAQRQAMQQMGDINAQTNQQAATARLQEQAQAQGLLGQVSGQAVGQGLTARGQDIGIAGQNAGFQQEAGLAGYQGNLQTNLAQGQIGATQAGQLFGAQQTAGALNAQLTSQQQAQYNTLMAQYAQMGLSTDQANQQATIEVQKIKSAQDLEHAKASSNMLGGLVGGAAGILGGMAASDRALKTDIKPGDAKLEAFLSAVGAHDYKYKDDKFGKGRRISPMAQELEADPIGKAFVKDTSEGKMVDYGKALGTMLSAQGMLMRRIKQLEGKN